MPKAPAKPKASKQEEALPDNQAQKQLLISCRAFAADPRLTRLREALHALAHRPPQSLLLEGGNARERSYAALYWATLLNCSTENCEPCLACPTCIQLINRMHRDLFYFDGAAASIKIDDIRAMRAQLGEAPREIKTRIVIFHEGQALGDAAANALLKSLEDPRPGNAFVLTAPQRERLLPTLVSRSWVLTLPWPRNDSCEYLDDEELARVSGWARALLDFAVTGKGWMERTGQRGSLDSRQAIQLTLYCQNALKDALRQDEDASALTPLSKAFAALGPSGCGILGEVLAECQESLFYNVNPVLVADWLATRVFFLFVRERSATWRG